MFQSILIALLMPCLALNAPDTEQPAKAYEPPTMIQPDLTMGKPVVVRIGSTNPDSVASTLSKVFPRLMVSMVHDSSMIVIRGTEGDTRDAQALIKEMTGDGAFQQSEMVKLFYVAGGRPRDIVSQLMPIFSRTGLNIAADDAHSTLLVRGSQDTIRQVEALMQQIDHAPQQASLEFSFLTASAAPAQGGIAVPPDLAKTAEELKRFGQLSLMGRLQTVATEGEDFDIEGQVLNSFTARIKGKVKDFDSNGNARLELDAMIVKFKTDPAGGQKVSSEKTYSMRTMIRIAPNTDIAVGVAPAGASVGESGILIVRMSK
jgi:hypothetical protein